MTDLDAYLGRFRLYRRIRGGCWLNRKGMGWYRCRRQHYEQACSAPAVFSVLGHEDWS
jgi:hypothetical protein